MARLRRNEWNFAGTAAARITTILGDSAYADSPLGRAEPELGEYRSARRLDMVLFGRENPEEALITGELKVPWDSAGRTPYNSKLVNEAHSKATNAGAQYFLTWNVRRVVVWKTDQPGVPLFERVVYDKEIVPVAITSAADLERADVKDALASGIADLIAFLNSAITGRPHPTFLPLDRIFIARLEAALDFPIEQTANAISSRTASSIRFKREFEKWMREEQGWLVSASNQTENIERAARFSCYVLVNRLCFYNALRRRYAQLERLAIANNITDGEGLKRRLQRSFRQAERYTGNYETVFDGDLGDDLPFLADSAVTEWRNLVRTPDHYDFATINLDVIGAMYEQLITPEERHRYGQHYTNPFVVDLINSFAISSGLDQIFDPSCGGGTFLVRAYTRKSLLYPEQDHSDLIERLYGCDILSYACHFTTINLAVRDLIDEDNFPRIRLGNHDKL